MPKILVVEDDTYLAEGLKDGLEVVGYETICASNGLIGLQLVDECHPDLILCDIMMPVMDGYTVLKHIREDSSTTTTPFIFLTAKGDATDVEKGLKLGADDYIPKPYSFEDLLLRIQTVLARRALQTHEPRISEYQVFLSYSRQDIDLMRRVLRYLVSNRFRVWVDEEGLEPGTRSWRRTVQETIDKSGCIVVILSPNAKQSEWVEAELDYAEAQGKVIFPILANGSRSNAVPFGYTLAQWIDIVNKDYDTEMKKLVIAIRKHLNLS